jgi:transcription elongation factor Elf1
MIELKPNINRLSGYYECPECGGEVFISDFIINGMRNLADLKCKECQSEFLADLPTVFGIVYQTIINKNKLEIKETQGRDWAKELLESYKNQIDEALKISHEVREEKKDIILINCLDACYGHSLWKILNSNRYIEKFGKDYGICLMIPFQLHHLIPEGVSEVLEFYLPFKKYGKWFNAINQKIHELVASKTSCYLAVNHYSHIPQSYNISKFPILNQKVFPQKDYKTIVFLYREDQRIWGVNLWQQKRNIEKLFRYLKNYYPNLRFLLIGVGKRKKFNKEIVDLREEKFDIELEKKWIEEYKIADCLIGVHGSNMNLPSVLAKNMINLVPEYKYSNALEDMRLDPMASCPENLSRYRAIYGNHFLSDVSAQKVFKILVHQLELTKRNIFLANLNLEPKINDIKEWRKVKEFYKKIPKNLKLDKYSFFGQFTRFLNRLPFLKNFFKKIRRL